jgi:quercetin dioxygenase-like cupin family protein
MGYEVISLEDVPLFDTGQYEGDVSEFSDETMSLDLKALDYALNTEHVKLKVWYFDPDEEVRYHAHAEQEEIYYVIQGQFSLKIGRSGETEIVELDPGSVYRVGPEVGHGHRCVGDEPGIVLAIGAPNVSDPGLDPHSLNE